ncbi:IclR family transcriptional regulator [Dietzia psychralcaliphila]|uniref:IclR family transcriptional regulator n=3 Tax=Dietziaceae TaxID=85029 RepID=A0AAD0NRD0_9ACTN|nr:IclR family transcriptional regulator [Dietzia psychralcaliphila]PTM86158.1 IclR family transcriptional regulator [Dietzia psychralcaliphila]
MDKVPERPRHRMVDRVAAIMELVARSGTGLTLTAVAKALDAPISSTQGLLNGLVAVGYLDERNRVYTLGTAPYLLNVIAGRPPVTSVSREQLTALHAETGLTTALSTDVGDDLFYVDHVAADAHYAYIAENRLRRSLLRTSSGWLLLADREKRDVWAYLNARPAAESEFVDRFLASLEELRETGVCTAPGVAVDGGDGVSVALREGGRTIATVGVIAARDLIVQRSEELAQTCLRHATAWGLR